MLKTATGGTAATLVYDPMLRLYDVTGAASTRFAYDGLDMIAEYNAANALQRRFVFGPAADEPLVQYEGTGTTDRRWLHADERGSIVAISDAAGNMLTINRYDEFGKPQSTNNGRFQYTGQMWLPEVGAYDYKGRMYAPHLGRFMQTDPIDVAGGINLYAYVGNDPINLVDPMGLGVVDLNRTPQSPAIIPDIIVTGQRSRGFGGLSFGNGGVIGSEPEREIVVTGHRRSRGTNAPPTGQTMAQKMSEEEQEAAAEADEKICRIVRTRECCASAAERRGARVNGRPIPPLRTGVKGSWSGRDLAAGIVGVGVVAGVICLIAEPCGAVVGGALGIGGGTVLPAN